MVKNHFIKQVKADTSCLPTFPLNVGYVCILIDVPWYTCIEEISSNFKNPLTFSHIITHFQFLDDFISILFINIVFCWYSTSNEVFNLSAFLLPIHSSFFKMANSKAKRLNSIWFIMGKRFSNWSCFAKQTCLLL